MPSSSIFLTKLASVKRAGGWVVWSLASAEDTPTSSPSVSEGSTRSVSASSASGSSAPST